MTRLRVGCVGMGFIAGRHLGALTAMPDVEVVAVADPDVERAQAAAGRVAARAYDDGLALLATEDLDAVWLCVPPFAHGRSSRQRWSGTCLSSSRSRSHSTWPPRRRSPPGSGRAAC